MVKKIDAESVAREDMPSYKDRGILSRVKRAIDEGHKNLPEMMRRKTAEETDAGKGLGTFPKLGSPYKTDSNSAYNKRNGETRAKYNASNRVANKSSIADEINAEPKPTPVTPKKTESAPAPKATVKKTTVVAVKPSKSAPRESDSSRASRMAAYENWTKTNRDPMTSEYLGTEEDVNTPGKLEATENMKKGGTTKRRPPKPAKKAPARRFASGGSTGRSSASKRGDGCATKGHTKGKYC